MRREGRGGGGVAQRIRGDEESVCNHPDEPVVKALGQQQKHPFVRREGVGTRAVVQGMGEGGGRRPNNDEP